MHLLHVVYPMAIQNEWQQHRGKPRIVEPNVNPLYSCFCSTTGMFTFLPHMHAPLYFLKLSSNYKAVGHSQAT